MDEKSWSSECAFTLSGSTQVTAKLLPSGWQEICDFLFFKLYLPSMRYPVEPLQVLWQPVTPMAIPISVQRSSAVLPCRFRDEAGLDGCCMSGSKFCFFVRQSQWLAPGEYGMLNNIRGKILY